MTDLSTGATLVVGVHVPRFGPIPDLCIWVGPFDTEATEVRRYLSERGWLEPGRSETFLAPNEPLTIGGTPVTPVPPHGGQPNLPRLIAQLAAQLPLTTGTSETEQVYDAAGFDALMVQALEHILGRMYCDHTTITPEAIRQAVAIWREQMSKLTARLSLPARDTMKTVEEVWIYNILARLLLVPVRRITHAYPRGIKNTESTGTFFGSAGCTVVFSREGVTAYYNN